MPVPFCLVDLVGAGFSPPDIQLTLPPESAYLQVAPAHPIPRAG